MQMKFIGSNGRLFKVNLSKKRKKKLQKINKIKVYRKKNDEIFGFKLFVVTTFKAVIAPKK